MEKENIVKLDKPRVSRAAKNPTNCKLCDGHLAPKTAKNHKIHYRQSTLSEYFPQQEVDKPCAEGSKKAVVMVNFRKLVRQLLNAKVIVERLSQAEVKEKQYPKVRIEIERSELDPQQPEGEPLEDDDPKYTLLYCHKCKKMHVERVTFYAEKKCQKCGAPLLFVCTKCRSNPYWRNTHMRRHRANCDGRKKASGSTSMELYFCADCDFLTAYVRAIKKHVARTQHREVERSKD